MISVQAFSSGRGRKENIAALGSEACCVEPHATSGAPCFKKFRLLLECLWYRFVWQSKPHLEALDSRGVKLLTEDCCHSISSRSLRYLLAQPHQNDTLLKIPKPIAICQPTLGITAAHDQTNNFHLGLCEARARSLSLSLSLSLYYIIY